MGIFRAAVAVFTVHVVLLFFPPLPPLWKGSVWSYVLGYLAVILAVRSFGSWAPLLTAWWGRRPGVVRWLQAMAVLAATAAFGFGVRSVSTDVFGRFSREEGVWEPINLLAYVASAILLFRAAKGLDERAGRHAKLIGGCFVFLTLEEIDYFGIFGGIIGRVDGHYVGTLHDVIMLVRDSLLPTPIAIALVSTVLLLFAWLAVKGFVQPDRLLRVATSSQLLWLASGFVFLFVAASEEAALFGVRFGHPSPEEMIEMLGGLSLAGFALSVHAALTAEPATGEPRSP